MKIDKEEWKKMSSKEKIAYLWSSLFTREMIAYLVAGVLATIVNIVSYEVSYRYLGLPNLVSNAVAWVFSVIFAYYTNRNYVFHEQSNSFSEELSMMGKFFVARLLSFGIDELGMFCMVDCLMINSSFSKLVMNAVVIIMNYVFSKLYIFKGNEVE